MTSAIKWPCLCDPSFLLREVVEHQLKKLKHHHCPLPDSGYTHCGIMADPSLLSFHRRLTSCLRAVNVSYI